MEKSGNPRFSVVVPVYNDEKAIADTLESVLSQDYPDYEIVVVDDGSIDDSLAVIQAFEKRDGRIIVCSHKSNRGAYQARKTGVSRTSGTYVLFLDGDDTLAPGALSRLDNLSRETPVDVLHFAIRVVPVRDVDEEKARGHELWLMPFHGVFFGPRVMEACLLDELYCWNLCGKLIDGDLCREAFSCCGDGTFSRAEDMVAYLMCAFFARSYRGAPTEFLYNYNYGAGGDGSDSISADQLERKWLCYPELISEFDSFCADHLLDDNVRRVYDGKLSDILLRDTADSFAGVLARDSYADALDKAICSWGSLEFLPQLAIRFWEDQGRICRDAAQASLFDVCVVRPKRIGLYYSNIKSEREFKEVRSVVNSWKAKGCAVYLLVDDRLGERYLSKLSDTPVSVIQPKYGISSGAMKLRFQALQFIIERDSLDTIVYGQWLSHVMVWDVCFLKSLSINTVVHFSTALARPLRKLRSYFSTQPFVFALCDGVTFDDDPTNILRGCSVPLRRQLIWARIMAMAYRAERIMPAPFSRIVIGTMRDHSAKDF